MPRLQLPLHVHAVRSKGREYFYYQRFRGTQREQKRVALPGCPQNPDGTPNVTWWTAYRKSAGIEDPSPRVGTFAALITAYKVSPEFARNAKSTTTNWTRYLAEIERRWSDTSVAGLEPKHVLALRDRYADVPPADPVFATKPTDEYRNRQASADNLLRCLSAMLSWSVPRGWRTDNPCIHVPKLDGGTSYSAWPEEIISLVRDSGPAWMWHATAIAFYTGQRQGDCLAMRWDHIKGGFISICQEKTKTRLEVQIHPTLRTVLDSIPKTSVRILTNTRGMPWTSTGFRSSWQKAMAEPKSPRGQPRPEWRLKPIVDANLVFHGLRKSATVALLECGCTDEEVASITGQSREMIVLYGQQVRRKKLSATAVRKWTEAEQKKATEDEGL